MSNYKPQRLLPYYVLDEVKKDLNAHFGEYAKNKNYIDEQAFENLDEPEEYIDLTEEEKLPIFPFDNSVFIDEDVVQSLVIAYWYWAIEEKNHKEKGQIIDSKYIEEFLYRPIDKVKEGAKTLLEYLKDQPMREEDDDLEFVLEEVAGKSYCYSPNATLKDALKRIPGAREEYFIREERIEDGKEQYRFIDTSFGDSEYSLERELKRRGYELSDITVTGDDTGDDISMGLDTLLGITEFLKERKYETQLAHWRSIVEDSKVLSEIEKRSPLVFWV